MATTPKTGRTTSTRRSTRAKKPTTIDLEAKKPDPKEGSDKAGSAADKKQPASSTSAKPTVAAAPKSTASPKAEGSSKSAGDSKKAEPAKTTQASSNGFGRDGSRKVEKPAEKRSGVLVPALLGAALSVVGLGAIGQVPGAQGIPLIGSLYGGGTSVASDGGNSAELDALREQIANMPSSEVDVSPLIQRLDALEEASNSPSEDAPVDEVLLERITKLETALAEADNAGSVSTGESSALTGVETEIANLAVRIETLESRIADATASNELDGLKSELGEVSNSLEAIRSSVDANSAGLTELSNQSTDLKETVASVKASEKVARSVAVNSLATALENDDSLALPVASLEALIGETDESKRLSELASAGIPTRKSLVEDLDAFVVSLGNPSAPSEDASLSERFWANAQKLVTFRSSGPRAGDDPLAVLSRVKAAVEADNFEAAKTEWLKLPVDVRKEGEAWIARLEMRAEAFALQRSISDNLAAEAG